jgi:mitotic spindle assembly checkpoint protein MAD2B
VHDTQRKVRERWVFDVERFPAWGTRNEGASAESDAAAAAAAPTSHQQQEDEEDEDEEEDDTVIGAAEALNWADIHEALRGALQRLAYAAQGAEKLPEGCTFTLALELREEAEAPIGVSKKKEKTKKKKRKRKLFAMAGRYPANK